ncbi:unnamed protein product [Meloidogyne enterolobii]|uniref:Uncharacterized protein n=1 Tax=Meloidogyne enterolobii TaxID=390850 RepID=A0ACB0YLA1_MELEN
MPLKNDRKERRKKSIDVSKHCNGAKSSMAIKRKKVICDILINKKYFLFGYGVGREEFKEKMILSIKEKKKRETRVKKE